MTMVIRKLKENKGVTLVEMLCVIVILVIVTAMLTTGIRFGTKTYKKTVRESEAEMLMLTLTTRIRDEIQYAGTTKVDSNGQLVSFFSQRYGEITTSGSGTGTVPVFHQDQDGHVMIGNNYIVGNSAYTQGIRGDVSVKYVETAQAYEVVLHVKNQSGKKLKSTTFQVKPINGQVDKMQ